MIGGIIIANKLFEYRLYFQQGDKKYKYPVHWTSNFQLVAGVFFEIPNPKVVGYSLNDYEFDMGEFPGVLLWEVASVTVSAENVSKDLVTVILVPAKNGSA